MSHRRDFANNHRVLTQALNAFVAYLTARLAGDPAPLGAYLETPPALALLSERLGLSRFEQDLLLLAAAVDLDPRFRDLLAQAHGDVNQPWLSFELALRLLPESAVECDDPGRPSAALAIARTVRQRRGAASAIGGG